MSLGTDEIALEQVFKRDPLMDLSTRNFVVKERYKVLKLWTETSRTNIFSAYDLKDQRPVYLHVVKNHLFRRSEELQQWVKSLKAMRRIDAPNLCMTVLDLDLWKKKLVCVTSVFEGLALHHLMADRRELPLQFVLRIILQLSELLKKASEVGFISRNISREDLFVNAEGDLRLLRFSPSRISGLSPEQVRDTSPDQYFLGCLLFELICHEAPFSGARKHIDLERAHLLAVLKTRQNQAQRDIFMQIADFFVRSCVRDSDKRWESLEEMIVSVGRLSHESVRLVAEQEMRVEKEQLNSAFDVVYALRGEQSQAPVEKVNPYSRIWSNYREGFHLDAELFFRIIAVFVIILSFSYKFFQGGGT